MEKRGIKETKELLEGLTILASEGLEMVKDGFSISDIKHVIALARQSEKLEAAVKGFDLIDDELKNLDEEETKEIVSLVFKMIKELKEAYK